MFLIVNIFIDEMYQVVFVQFYDEVLKGINCLIRVMEVVQEISEMLVIYCEEVWKGNVGMLLVICYGISVVYSEYFLSYQLLMLEGLLVKDCLKDFLDE